MCARTLVRQPGSGRLFQHTRGGETTLPVEPDFFIAPLGEIASVAITGAAIYILLVAMLRLSGKRTLAKFNAFDFVVTVAIGSMVANTILDEDTSLVEGATGIVVLLVAQMIVSLLVTHSPSARRLIKSRPRLLFYQGAFLRKNLVLERIAVEEIRQEVRDSGFARMDDVLAVILESDGTLSVIPAGDYDAPLDALATVHGGKYDMPAVGERMPPVAEWDAERRSSESARKTKDS